MPAEITIYGTGFLVHPSGAVLTAGHVVRGVVRRGNQIYRAEWVEVSVRRAGGPPMPAQVVALERTLSRDIALLRLPPEQGPYPYLSLQEELPEEGTPVWSAGFPRDSGGKLKVLPGVVSQIVYEGTQPVGIEHTAPLQPGFSGGPLLVESGRVVGLNVWLLRGTPQRIALPANILREFLEKNGYLPGGSPWEQVLQYPDWTQQPGVRCAARPWVRGLRAWRGLVLALTRREVGLPGFALEARRGAKLVWQRVFPEMAPVTWYPAGRFLFARQGTQAVLLDDGGRVVRTETLPAGGDAAPWKDEIWVLEDRRLRGPAQEIPLPDAGEALFPLGPFLAIVPRGSGSQPAQLWLWDGEQVQPVFASSLLPVPSARFLVRLREGNILALHPDGLSIWKGFPPEVRRLSPGLWYPEDRLSAAPLTATFQGGARLLVRSGEGMEAFTPPQGLRILGAVAVGEWVYYLAGADGLPGLLLAEVPRRKPENARFYRIPLAPTSYALLARRVFGPVYAGSLAIAWQGARSANLCIWENNMGSGEPPSSNG